MYKVYEINPAHARVGRFLIDVGQIIKHPPPNNRRRSRSQPLPTFLAEPVTVSNSFVGTEEYIAPEIITGVGHSNSIDWWALAVHLSEVKIDKRHLPTFCTKTSLSQVAFRLAGRQLLNLLLNRDPADRLGSNSGANEIKQHPFFRGINWPLIRTMSLPPLDAPPELIEKDLKAKDVKWEDDGVLVNPVDLDLF